MSITDTTPASRLSPIHCLAPVAAAIVLTLAAACQRQTTPPPPRASAPSQPDRAHIIMYNRGTTLLGRDSLRSALLSLDSARESPDSTIAFRAAFNSGWDHLTTAVRAVKAFRRGGAYKDSLLAVLMRDTTLRDVLSAATAHPADSASLARDTMAFQDAPAVGSLSPQAQLALAGAYVQIHLRDAVAEYRTALMLHPMDQDAKWNYELALQVSRAAGNGKGEGGKTKGKKKKTDRAPSGKGKNNKGHKKQDEKGTPKQFEAFKKGKTKMVPPMTILRLPPQQAEQLLNAVGQYEQKHGKMVPVPAAPPPQGKDW